MTTLGCSRRSDRYGQVLKTMNAIIYHLQAQGQVERVKFNLNLYRKQNSAP